MGIKEDARVWAVDQIERYGSPPMPLFLIAEAKARELAKKLGADEEIVFLGNALMDIKLGIAVHEGTVPEHTQMSVDAAKEFLEKHDYDIEKTEKVLNCIAAHHGKIPFSCIESEIVANADCYKFLDPKGFFSFLCLVGKREMIPEQAIVFAGKKLDEKWSVLTMQECKDETAENYRMLKALLDDIFEVTPKK